MKLKCLSISDFKLEENEIIDSQTGEAIYFNKGNSFNTFTCYPSLPRLDEICF